MYFCAGCDMKTCAREMGKEGTSPRLCPTLSPEMKEYLRQYEVPEDRRLARAAAICGPDHSECRILKTIRFAHECGFQKLGLAFCSAVREQAKAIDRLLRAEGFAVESVICKVGHEDKSFLDVPPSCKAMCNPVAQAELMNRQGTELNLVVGLCVGHDSLFIRHSNAPVTVLAAKDHVYHHAPLEYLKEKKLDKDARME